MWSAECYLQDLEPIRNSRTMIRKHFGIGENVSAGFGVVKRRLDNRHFR